MRDTRSVGFVGLGNMGAPMAQRLLDAGHALVVHDVRPDVREAWRAAGCTAVASAAEVGEAADTVLLSLPTPDIVESVALGADGVAAGRAVRTIVDLSTTGPATSEAVASALAARSIAFVDAPVSGGVAGAKAGTLAVMVACPREHFDALSPLLGRLGRLFHVGGRAGMAQTMKLTNNLLSAAALVLTSEAVVIGVKVGLDPATMIEVFNVGSGRNSATQDKFPKAILSRTFDAGFSAGLMHKDVALCLAQARKLGLELPAAEAVLEVWRRTVDDIGPGADFTAVVHPIERAAGVVVQKI